MRVAVVNEKGGVGKTTTTLLLGYVMQRDVTLVDLDKNQHSLTALFLESMNLEGLEDVKNGIDDAIEGWRKGRKVKPTVWDVELGGRSLRVVPSSPKLREVRIGLGLDLLRKIFDEGNVVFDTPPEMGDLTKMAIYSADAVIVPVELSTLSLTGFVAMYEEVGVDVVGMGKELYILPTMFRGTRVEKTILAELRDRFGEMILDPIPHSAGIDKLLWEKTPLEECGLDTAKKVLKNYEKVAEVVFGGGK